MQVQARVGRLGWGPGEGGARPGALDTQATPGVGKGPRWGIPGLARAPGLRPVHWERAHGESQPPGWHRQSF